MENNMQNKEKLLHYLEIIRDNQALKPPEEMNRELLEGTIDLLLKLQNKKADLTPEEIKERVRKIPFVETPDFEDAPQKIRKKINKRKILLIAEIIAILCTLLGIISSGYDLNDMHRTMREKFGTVFNVPVGEEQLEGNQSFYKDTDGKSYETIQEFLEEEKMIVLLPSDLPDNVIIKSIDVRKTHKEEKVVRVVFNDKITEFSVTINGDIPLGVIENYDDIVTINSLHCYIDRLEDIGVTQIHFKYRNDYYLIGGADEQILLDIIENLEEQ